MPWSPALQDAIRDIHREERLGDEAPPQEKKPPPVKVQREKRITCATCGTIMVMRIERAVWPTVCPNCRSSSRGNYRRLLRLEAPDGTPVAITRPDRRRRPDRRMVGSGSPDNGLLVSSLEAIRRNRAAQPARVRAKEDSQ